MENLYMIYFPMDGTALYRYASVQAMESSSKLDDEQWLAYWILYSFITLMEMLLQSLIYW